MKGLIPAFNLQSGARGRSGASSLSTAEIGVVIALWGAMAVLVGGILSELTSDVDTPLAKSQAEAYARQLSTDEGSMVDKSTSGAVDRQPASVDKRGALGMDPWGQPYNYKIVNSAVVVWSNGRNQVQESEVEIESIAAGSASLSRFRFQGDDVGYIVRTQ